MEFPVRSVQFDPSGVAEHPTTIAGVSIAHVHWIVLPSRPNTRTMAQDPQAQAIRKRKATLKIARLKAKAEMSQEAAPKKEKKEA